MDVEESKSDCASMKPNKNLYRLEHRNKTTFTVFKILGLFLIKWNDTLGYYTVHNIRFIIYYTLWFLWPLAGLGVALLGKKFFSTGNEVDNINDVIETSLFILGFAVVPAMKTYSISLITKHLPEVLEDITSLCETDIGFETPLTIRFASRKIQSLNPRKAAQEIIRSKRHGKVLLYLPVITVILSIIAFLVAWIFGFVNVVEWNTFKKEWHFFTMLISYLMLPSITTWFSILFIEWCRMVYENLRTKVELYQFNVNSSLSETNGVSSPASFTLEKIKLIGDYIDKLQEIFSGLSNGFIQYIMGINILVFIISSVFCTAKLLEGFQQIIYIVPLSIANFHLGLACYKSHGLIDEYQRILSSLKQILRLQRNHPDLMPFQELHILRENLLDSPPQVEIFGSYRVDYGFLLGLLGFVITYAVLANDVVNMLDNSACNITATERRSSAQMWIDNL